MFFLVVFLIFTSVTFYGVKHFGIQSINDQRALFKQEKKDFSGLIEKEKDVQELNSRLLKIDKFNRQKINLENVFNRIEKIASSNILLKSFDYKRVSTGKEKNLTHQVILEGKASTWEDLLSFEKKLKNNFSEVNFSKDSWSQVKNINFLVKFNANEEKK